MASAAPSSAPAVQHAEPVKEHREPLDADAKAGVTPQPIEQIRDRKFLGKHERVEYRDEEGNLLPDDLVESLAAEGSVTFKTKYETKTRLVDKDGNEVRNWEGIAPEHPDVEGQNPDTKGLAEDRASERPAHVDVSMGGDDVGVDDGRPRPASEAQEATR